MTYNALVTAPRRTLADLNASFRSSSETSDFVLTTEYRVGRYGLRVSRDGYGSRGVGGKLRHLMVATVITEIKPDYNWQPYCAEMVSGYRGTPEQRQERRERQIASHGTYSHYCRQPKVGEVVYARQQCVDQNAVGKGAYEPSDADTNVIDCNNCAVRVFGEVPQPRAKVEAAAREARAAVKAKNPPPVCFHCGDRRPKTRATDAGEKLLCSSCKDSYETIWFVETTGYTCQYHADMADARDSAHTATMLARALADQTREYDELLRREGRYAR